MWEALIPAISHAGYDRLQKPETIQQLLISVHSLVSQCPSYNKVTKYNYHTPCVVEPSFCTN